MRTNDIANNRSQSNNFPIQGASGTGLPPISYEDLGTFTSFHISTQTSDDPSAFSTTFEDFSSITEDSTPSSTPTTSANNSPMISPAQSTATETGAGTLSESSPPTGTPVSPPLGQSTSPTSTHHMSGGAIAAITISTLFATAIGVALFIYFRHRRRRRIHDQRHSPSTAEMTEMQPEPYSDKEVHQTNYNTNGSSTTPSTTNASSSPLLSKPSETVIADSNSSANPDSANRRHCQQSLISNNSTSSFVNSPRLSELAASSPVRAVQQRGSELDGSSGSARV